jgi:hypothetical protein
LKKKSKKRVGNSYQFTMIGKDCGIEIKAEGRSKKAEVLKKIQ